MLETLFGINPPEFKDSGFLMHLGCGLMSCQYDYPPSSYTVELLVYDLMKCKELFENGKHDKAKFLELVQAATPEINHSAANVGKP
jgi:hypothetical protein